MNYCSDCGAQIEELDIFEESKTDEGPFGPEPFKGTQGLQLDEFKQPFQAWADDKLKFWLLIKDQRAHRARQPSTPRGS